MKYIIEYYLPGQSHLFSEPFRHGISDEEELIVAAAIAEANGYDLIGVYEQQAGRAVPIADNYNDIHNLIEKGILK